MIILLRYRFDEIKYLYLFHVLPKLYTYHFFCRTEKEIKHCRIKLEGRLYTIGTVKFESLVELVLYYEKHPLYKKVKLWYPISEDIVRRIITVSDSFIVAS